MANRTSYDGVIKVSTARRVVLDTGTAGQTVAVTISKNGAAFANPSAGATNATAISDGLYYVDLSTTDTNTTGPLVVKGNGAGDLAIVVHEVGTNPTDPTQLLDLTDGIETGRSPRQALRAIAAAAGGNATKSGSTTTYAALGNSGTARLAVTNPLSTTRTVTPTLT